MNLLENCEDKVMGYGVNKGKRFSWICKNRPSYVDWSSTQIPDCAPDTFNLVMYRDYQRILACAEAMAVKWSPRLKAHREHMRRRKNGYGTRRKSVSAQSTLEGYQFT